MIGRTDAPMSSDLFRTLTQTRTHAMKFARMLLLIVAGAVALAAAPGLATKADAADYKQILKNLEETPPPAS